MNIYKFRQYTLPFLSLFLMLNVGCKKTVENCKKGYLEGFKNLQCQSGTISLSLDSQQVVGWMTPLQISKNEDELIVLDEYGKRLFYYNINNKFKLNKIITLKRELLPNKIMNFIDMGNDVIAFYGYSGHKLIFYSLKNHTVINSENFEPPKEAINPFDAISPSLPFFSNASPVIIKDSLIIGFGYSAGEIDMENPEKRTICSIINPKKNTKQYKIIYPKLYWLDNWGGVYFRAVFSCVNNIKKFIIVSFPADHKIHIYDEDWIETEIDARTRQNICINPMAIKKTNKKMNNREYVFNHYLTNSSYGAIIYDPYRDHYWRVIEMAVTKEELMSNNVPVKVPNLILFDNQFNYKGEISLPKGISTTNYFVTKDGLFFLNLNNKNEDIASFFRIQVCN